ncbi:hypothetical protein EYR40_008019 [Pleurotus pulmonarius]|nr:hypothetical protein EYR40_008019 [Pleurotus pulmonarius]
MGCIVQGYFAYRIFVLSGGLIIPIIAATGSALQLAGCFAMGILGHPLPVNVFASRYAWVITSVVVLDLFTDTLNTAAICYYLRLSKRDITSTNRALDILFTWSIQTGIVLSVTALIILIFVCPEQTLEGTAMWISVSLFYGKLYSNTFMASLNGRNFLRRAVLDKTMNTLDTTTAISEGPNPAIRVNVQKTTYREDVIEMGSMDGRSKTFTKQSSEGELV